MEIDLTGKSATAPTDLLTEQVWRRVQDVNLTGTFLMCKAVMPVMKQQRSGRIINAASFAALIPVVGHAAYASSKAAVVHFTRAIAGELGPATSPARWSTSVAASSPPRCPARPTRTPKRQTRARCPDDVC